MFKPLKKRNDNFVKRDFFAVKKTKQKRYAIVGGKIEGVNCFIVDNSIENLPTPNQVFFFLTQKNKPSSFFIDEIAKRERVIECVMIVSKLSQRFAELLPILKILDGSRDCFTGKAICACGDINASICEPAKCD